MTGARGVRDVLDEMDVWIIEDSVDASTTGDRNASQRLETFNLGLTLEEEAEAEAEVEGMFGCNTEGSVQLKNA